jgi:rhodanese-related sulfurtransferase
MNRGALPPRFPRILLEAAVIVALGAVIGLSVHYRLLIKHLEGRAATSSPSLQVDSAPRTFYPAPVGLAEAEELLREGALAIDARNQEAYREGHLPGARSFPLDDLDASIDLFRQEVPRQTTLIVYCSGYGCSDSFTLAVRLMTEDYGEVRVYEGGFPEWRDSGRPVVKGEP